MAELSAADLKLIPLLKGLRFLIADPTSSRKSCRALFSEYQVRPEQIDVVDNAAEALELCKARPFNVIFTDYTIGAQTVFEMLRLQLEKTSPGEVRTFFLMTSQDSNSVVTSAASENVDAIIVKPFSFGILKERFTEVLTQKLAPTPYVQALDKGRALLKSEKFDEALAAFAQAKKLDPKPALALAHEAEVYQKQGQHEQAVKSFGEALKINATQFRSLLGSVDSLTALNKNDQAYEFARKLAENHTVPAKRIPDMIRLSIMTQHFEDVVGFYETAGDLTQMDDSLAQHLGAGLVICGLHFLKKNDRTAALDAFRKAEVASKQNPKILMRILQALIAAGMENEMKAFMARVPDEIRNSPDVQFAEIEFSEKAGAPLRALEQALKLVQQGVKHERLFEKAIHLSIGAKRKDSLIEELVFKAGSAFPDKKAFFEGLLKKSP